jgi:hypothetical protein
MRLLATLVFLGLASAAYANEWLWSRIKMESNIVVLTGHMESAGGKPLVWDESGGCKDEARLTAEGRTDSRNLGKRCRETATLAFGEALVDPDLREIASADTARLRAFDRKATSLLLEHRGRTPIVFVSHRPNIELLTLELVDEGELVVGKISDSGEVQVLGKTRLPR